MDDENWVLNARSRGHRHHEGVADKGVREVVEGVGFMLLLTRLTIELADLVQHRRTPGIAKNTLHQCSRGGRRMGELAGDRNSVYDHSQAGEAAYLVNKGG